MSFFALEFKKKNHSFKEDFTEVQWSNFKSKLEKKKKRLHSYNKQMQWVELFWPRLEQTQL